MGKKGFAYIVPNPPMETKQLLRHLLRQASVLYDDVARIYITRYIVQRFRVNLTADSWRRTKLLKEGRRGLSILIRANAGDPKPLTKIMEMSYGRTGRRKHELLEVCASSEVCLYVINLKY